MSGHLLVNVPEHHEETDVFLLVELSTGQPLRALAVFGSLMGLCSTLSEDVCGGLRKVYDGRHGWGMNDWRCEGAGGGPEEQRGLEGGAIKAIVPPQEAMTKARGGLGRLGEGYSEKRKRSKRQEDLF